MGVDTTLISDGTYFVVEQKSEQKGEVNKQKSKKNKFVGCGGWSRRATLFGGDQTAGRDARLLDRSTEPARVRLTGPTWTSRAKGSAFHIVIVRGRGQTRRICLAAMSTLAGEALYTAYGFVVAERTGVATSRGIKIPLIRMTKSLSSLD